MIRYAPDVVPAFYHYTNFGEVRTYGIEVDVIVELSSGEIYAFEVKASATYKADQFRGLTYLRDKLGDRFLGGFVFGTAPQGYRFADKLWGLPVSALWSI